MLCLPVHVEAKFVGAAVANAPQHPSHQTDVRPMFVTPVQRTDYAAHAGLTQGPDVDFSRRVLGQRFAKLDVPGHHVILKMLGAVTQHLFFGHRMRIPAHDDGFDGLTQ